MRLPERETEARVSTTRRPSGDESMHTEPPGAETETLAKPRDEKMSSDTSSSRLVVDRDSDLLRHLRRLRPAGRRTRPAESCQHEKHDPKGCSPLIENVIWELIHSLLSAIATCLQTRYRSAAAAGCFMNKMTTTAATSHKDPFLFLRKPRGEIVFGGALVLSCERSFWENAVIT